MKLQKNINMLHPFVLLVFNKLPCVIQEAIIPEELDAKLI